jgi:universal stress protein A
MASSVFQTYLQELKRSGERQLKDVTIPGMAAPTIQRKVQIGAPISRITEYAGENAIDLIVMGTHGRTGASHWLLGSVAERVVRSAPCPVMVCRRTPPAPTM